MLLLEGYYDEGTFFNLGSEPVTLKFTSDSIVEYQGFRLHFYVGETSPGKYEISLL